MSVRLWKLNGDASFLLSFYDAGAASTADVKPLFTILIDPWLEGKAEVFHSKFSCSRLALPTAITSLAEIDPPDLILISQDKADHCNRGTLCKLDPAADSEIYAGQAGSTIINSWNHFRKEKVHALKDWARNSKTDKALHIPILSQDEQSCASPGEISVLFLPSPAFDMSNLHTAIGIVYWPPSKLPMLPTPPSSPAVEDALSAPIISILVSPHGPATLKSIEPFADYLDSISASPLTLLMHCFDSVKNPRILGGVVSAGGSCGIEVARRFRARYWVSLHDEDKVVTGVATHWVKISKSPGEELQKALEGVTKVVEVACGEAWTFNG